MKREQNGNLEDRLLHLSYSSFLKMASECRTRITKCICRQIYWLLEHARYEVLAFSREETQTSTEKATSVKQEITTTWLNITSYIQTTWCTLPSNHILQWYDKWRLTDTQSVLTTANTTQIRVNLASPGGAAEQWRLLECHDTWSGKLVPTFRKHAVHKQRTSWRRRRRRYDRSWRR